MSDGDVRYRFLSVLGEGGFGKVYHARMEAAGGFHKDVAIKVLHDPDPPRSLLQRHRDEARILGLIRDRTIVGVEPPIRVGTQWAVVMEFVDGVSCGALIDKGPLPPGVAIEIVGEVARALHNVYQMEGPDGGPLQLLHRDIKPDNIQVTPAGEIRLLDFGIARANFSAREFKTRHSLGGTPGYIAPERLHGVENPAGDVFSLGVVLHEIVTGTRPALPTTVQLEGTTHTVDTEELEATPEQLGSAELKEVLKLAGWMRADEPEDRPSAREVEKECRRLRHAFAPPYLRDWAEESVPHRTELAADEMIGRLLTGNTGTELTVTPGPAPSLPPSRAGAQLAMGAALGGGMLVLGGLLIAAVLVLLVALVRWSTPPEIAQTEPPVPVEVAPEPVAPEPVVVPVPVVPVVVEPAPVVPERPSPVPRPVPAVVVPVAPVPVEPKPDPAPATAATVAQYMVTFTSIPLGAEVVLVESGESLGHTPVRRTLGAGTLRVRMTTDEGKTGESAIRVGRTMPTRYTWKSAEDRWESGY